MSTGRKRGACALILICALAPVVVAQSRVSRPGRLVLVELFTSQGCNMCPEAEKNLGNLGDGNRSVAPVALHVDYFDRPWKDPFSAKLHSERQMSYHNTYKGPKDPSLGLYYTPMMMVDGVTHINGRDPASLKAAVAAARQKPPGVTIRTKLDPPTEARKTKLTVTVEPVADRLKGREQLVCAVLREDQVSTDVKSGENAGKTLANRFPARQMQFETVKLEPKKPRDVPFEFTVDPAWNAANLAIVVFVQDVATGEVHQSAIAALRKTETDPAKSGP